MPLSVLPTEPRYWRATFAVLVPALRSPVSSMTSTPWSWGAVAGSPSSSSTRRWLSCSWSQGDSDTKNCRPCTAPCCAPTTGSGQTGQGLVAVSWQQQALQVGAQAAPLRQPAKQRVELGGVALQGTGGGWAGQALGHRGTSASSRMAQPPAFPLPAPANTPPLDGWVEIGAYPGESRILVTGGAGTHSTRVRSGFPFSTTYVASSAALPLPAFLTAGIVPAGTSKTSPALSVVGGLPSI